MPICTQLKLYNPTQNSARRTARRSCQPSQLNDNQCAMETATREGSQWHHPWLSHSRARDPRRGKLLSLRNYILQDLYTILNNHIHFRVAAFQLIRSSLTSTDLISM